MKRLQVEETRMLCISIVMPCDQDTHVIIKIFSKDNGYDYNYDEFHS